jgi:hypothetical protein
LAGAGKVVDGAGDAPLKDAEEGLVEGEAPDEAVEEREEEADEEFILDEKVIDQSVCNIAGV